MKLDLSKSEPLPDEKQTPGAPSPVKLDLSKSEPLPQEDDPSKGLYQKAKDWAEKPLVSPQGLANNLSPLSVVGLPGGAGMVQPDAVSPFKDKVAPLAPDLSAITNDPEKNKAEPWMQGFRGVEKGLYNIGSGMSSPLNLGMLAGGAMLPGVGLVLGAAQIPSMAKNAYQGLVEGKEARESGNYETAGEKYTSAASNLLNALGVAKGLGKVGKEIVSPEDPYNKAKSPEIQEIAKSGYPLNPAEITGRSIPNFMRGMFRRNPIANQEMQDFGLEQEGALNEDVGKFKEAVGSTPPEEIAANLSEKLPKDSYGRDVQSLKADFAEQEGARRSAYQKALEDAETGVKGLPQSDASASGAALEAAVKKAHTDLNADYQAKTAPIVKANLNQRSYPEPLRKQIVDILDQNGLIDEKGNILRDDINNVVSPQRKAFLGQLADISESLTKSPTIKRLSQVTQDLQDLANFGASERTPQEKMFGSLSHTSKEALLDSLEKYAGPENVATLREARANYAATRPVLDELSSATSNKYGSQIVKGAKSGLPPELLQSAGKMPQLSGPLGDVVVNNIVQSASSPAALTKAIDSYGRENLANILGPEKFQALTDAEANYSKAGAPFERAKPPQPIPQSPQSKFAEEIGTAVQSNPNGIADAVIKPGNVQRIKMAKELLGDGFDQVKQQFTQNILENAAKTKAGQTAASIAGGRLNATIKKYGMDVLSEIYTPEELAQLKDVATKANISESAIAARGKPPMRGAAGPLAAIKKLVESTVEPPIAKAFNNPTVARIASTKIPISTASAISGAVSNAVRNQENIGKPDTGTYQGIINYLNSIPKNQGKSAGLYKVDPDLAKIVQNVPNVVGYQPTVTSGFRTQAEQDALNVPGKAKISLHSSGKAVDQRIKDLTPEEIEATLKYYNSQPGVRAFIDNGNHLHIEKRT